MRIGRIFWRNTRENKLPNTWSVFLLGLLCLLSLLVLTSLNGLQRSRAVYDGLRQRQDEYVRRRVHLETLANGILLISVTVREFFMDTSRENDRTYRQRMETHKANIESALTSLREDAEPEEREILSKLQNELQRYWASIFPVLNWTPEERAEKGTYFLRQEQRPRRQSVLAVADEIRHWNYVLYQGQLESINAGERQIRADLVRFLGISVLLGLIVTVATVFRIRALERRGEFERRQTENAREQLRQLSARLHHAQEEERRTIARELHDDVGQKLTALRYGLHAVERLHSPDDKQFRERLGELKVLNEESLLIIRNIAVGLRPSTLDDLGLKAAVQQLARDFSRNTDLNVSVDAEDEFGELDDQRKTYLYRIIQETLTNCAKHAKATAVEITLRHEVGALRLSIRDNGVGFDHTTAAGGSGLVGIGERVHELGGTMHIDSSSGRGTTVDVSLPTSSINDEQNSHTTG